MIQARREWGAVEMADGRQRSGRVGVADLGGLKFVAVDVLHSTADPEAGTSDVWETLLYNPAAVASIALLTEAEVRRAVRQAIQARYNEEDPF